MAMNPKDKVISRKPTKPVGHFHHVRQFGDTLYVSGQLPLGGNGLVFSGKVGSEVGLDDASEAAKLCVLNGFQAMHDLLGHDWKERIVILRHTVFVACGSEVVDLPEIANAASLEICEILGSDQVSARSAVGVCQLPANSPVEVEMTFGLLSTNQTVAWR